MLEISARVLRHTLVTACRQPPPVAFGGGEDAVPPVARRLHDSRHVSVFDTHTHTPAIIHTPLPT